MYASMPFCNPQTFTAANSALGYIKTNAATKQKAPKNRLPPNDGIKLIDILTWMKWTVWKVLNNSTPACHFPFLKYCIHTHAHIHTHVYIEKHKLCISVYQNAYFLFYAGFVAMKGAPLTRWIWYVCIPIIHTYIRLCRSGKATMRGNWEWIFISTITYIISGIFVHVHTYTNLIFVNLWQIRSLQNSITYFWTSSKNLNRYTKTTCCRRFSCFLIGA